MQEERQKRDSRVNGPSQEKGKWNILSTKNNINRAKTLENREVRPEREAGENPAMFRRATARLCAREKHGDTRALRR